MNSRALSEGNFNNYFITERTLACKIKIATVFTCVFLYDVVVNLLLLDPQENPIIRVYFLVN